MYTAKGDSVQLFMHTKLQLLLNKHVDIFQNGKAIKALCCYISDYIYCSIFRQVFFSIIVV